MRKGKVGSTSNPSRIGFLFSCLRGSRRADDLFGLASWIGLWGICRDDGSSFFHRCFPQAWSFPGHSLRKGEEPPSQ